MARDEAVIFGLRAALAVGEHRPEAILRVFHTRDRRKEIGPLLSVTANQRRPYREVPEDELRRIAGSLHHEGVVVIAEPLPLRSVPAMLDALPDRGVLLALDGVQNPHNQGAILRSAAWFDAFAVLLDESGPGLNPAAVRVAQGGAEVVPCVAAPDLPAVLDALARRGVTLIGADQHAKRGLFDQRLPELVCLVLGSEGEGLHPEVRRQCHQLIRIPGTAAVESLNVAVSAGILLAAAFADQA
ncbi:MAG: RNA methyltransferase [Myxococcales bacterium]|nr:RNA methyltransferase [Myxococcales bacterium]